MQQIKFAGVDWSSVARMLGSGALLGAGAGASVTFLKHLKELQDNAKPIGEDASDPNVLYVDLPAPAPKGQMAAQPVKRATANNNSNTASTFALSSLAALVGSGLAYSTVRDVYNRRRKREVENDLTNAQHIYLGGQAKMASQTHTCAVCSKKFTTDKGVNLYKIKCPECDDAKSASQYSMPTKMIGTGYLGFLLTALGSAVVAKKMLDKRFPPLESPTAGQPRKIVVRHVDPITHAPVDAGDTLDGSISPNAMEGVVRTEMSHPKMAAHNDIANVVAAAASGRAEEIRELIQSVGVDGMFDAVKGASANSTDPVYNNLAITWMCNDPLVSNAVAPVVASEFFKCASWTFELLPKLASLGLSESKLIGLVESAAEATRCEALKPVFTKLATVKQAAAEHGMSPMKTLFFAGALKTILDDPKRNQMSEHQDTNTVDGSESPGGKSKPKTQDGMVFEVSDDSANRFAHRMMPAVDKTLARQ
jgi:phage FluMu protein Com